MVLKSVFAAVIGTVLLAWSALALADEYRPDEFLGLDLSRAALSPKPLGPPSQFAPVGVEAKADRVSGAAPVRAERIGNLKIRAAHPDNEEHRAVAHTRLARSHRNSLEAQAFDTRIQLWPCRSGGICNWKPQAN
jgi:hypothetical protein